MNDAASTGAIEMSTDDAAEMLLARFARLDRRVLGQMVEDVRSSAAGFGGVRRAAYEVAANYGYEDNGDVAWYLARVA